MPSPSIGGPGRSTRPDAQRGTLIALCADEIVMDPNAVLGPVDPQIGDMPAASIVKLLEAKPVAQISDEMLVLADVAQKARVQVVSFVVAVLLKHLPKAKAGRGLGLRGWAGAES